MIYRELFHNVTIKTFLGLDRSESWRNDNCNKIAAFLTTKEANYGITHVILSYIYKFSDIGIKDSIEKYRLCVVICKQLEIKRHLQEWEHLRFLADVILNK